jgi:hypothetical protein
MAKKEKHWMDELEWMSCWKRAERWGEEEPPPKKCVVL